MLANYANIKSGYIGAWSLNGYSLKANEFGFIGLYTNYLDSSKSIAGSGAKDNWRIIVGDNFGVDRYGNLYSSGGIISNGNLTITANRIEGDEVSIDFLDTNQVNINGQLYVENRIACSSYISATSLRFGSNEITWATTSSRGSGSSDSYTNYYVINGALLTKIQDFPTSSIGGTFYVYSPDNTYQQQLTFTNGILTKVN